MASEWHYLINNGTSYIVNICTSECYTQEEFQSVPIDQLYNNTGTPANTDSDTQATVTRWQQGLLQRDSSPQDVTECRPAIDEFVQHDGEQRPATRALQPSQEHFLHDVDEEEETSERVEGCKQRQSHEPEGTQEFETNNVDEQGELTGERVGDCKRSQSQSTEYFGVDKDAEDDVVYVGMNPAGDARGATAEETRTANAESN